MSAPLLSEDRASAMLISAVETGIAYWMNEDATSVTIKRNEAWGTPDIDSWRILEVSFDFDGKYYSVTPEAMQAKAEAFKARYDWHFQDIIEENDDATTADAFFQFVAFDEIIFG